MKNEIENKWIKKKFEKRNLKKIEFEKIYLKKNKLKNKFEKNICKIIEKKLKKLEKIRAWYRIKL